jgi:hypothetical protein
VVLLYQFWPTTVDKAAAMFVCVPYMFDGLEHLANQENIICSDPKHVGYQILAGTVGVFWAIGVPAHFGYLLFQHRHVLFDSEHHMAVSASRKYGFLCGGFRKSRIWWEGVVMFRKLMFLMPATFLTGVGYTVNFKCGIQMVVLGAHQHFLAHSAWNTDMADNVASQ